MPKKTKMLSESIADDILTMITVEKRFQAGDKLPNENELSEELHVSRTTLREAIRILMTNNIVEIKRGKGTFVTEHAQKTGYAQMNNLAQMNVNIKDLFEMRLIFEPEIAYLAAKRATNKELQTILNFGKKIEEKILSGEDRTQEEQGFHKAIAKATHNEFMNKLIPIMLQAIQTGVVLLHKNESLSEKNIHDDRMIMEFLEERNAEGARIAMKLHIMHAIQELELDEEYI